ncbi:MAG: YfgM family protein [Stenotrophobium sp.]
MATYEEDEEVEKFKRWWNENWRSLAAGLVIGFGGIFGWQAYQHHEQGQAAQASQMYSDLKNFLQQHKLDEAGALGDRLATEYAGTPYAVAAALKLAQQDVEQGKLDNAAKRLQWVIDNSKDAGLVPLAHLRLARVLWQQQKPDDALKQLDGAQADKSDYAVLFDELRGDITLAKGDRAGARAAYEKAVQDGGAPANQPDKNDLQRKLDDLADVVAK